MKKEKINKEIKKLREEQRLLYLKFEKVGNRLREEQNKYGNEEEYDEDKRRALFKKWTIYYHKTYDIRYKIAKLDYKEHLLTRKDKEETPIEREDLYSLIVYLLVLASIIGICLYLSNS